MKHVFFVMSIETCFLGLKHLSHPEYTKMTQKQLASHTY
jgi:hypothetical protein